MNRCRSIAGCPAARVHTRAILCIGAHIHQATCVDDTVWLCRFEKIKEESVGEAERKRKGKEYRVRTRVRSRLEKAH